MSHVGVVHESGDASTLSSENPRVYGWESSQRESTRPPGVHQVALDLVPNVAHVGQIQLVKSLFR